MEIILRNITKRFSNTVVFQGLDLEIGSGEFFTVLGPSGCGKSTILNLIAGLEEPTEGEIYFGKKLMNNVHPRDRNVAMVFQSYALYPHMTVFDNIAFPLKMRKLKKEEIKRAVEEVAERLGLKELLHRKPRELSGGQRQRVALGRAIVRRPAVFLLDEPLSNLDARLRVDMRAELKKLHRELGITVVYVTHDQAEAMALSDRMAVINEGKIQQVGTPEEIYKRPANLFVATFIGSHPMNIMTATVVNKSPLSLRINSTEFELPFEFNEREESLFLGIRPEDVMIVEEKEDLEAEVELIENEGAFKLVDFSSEGIRFRARTERMVKVGQRLKIKFPPEHLHFFNTETGIRYNLKACNKKRKF